MVPAPCSNRSKLVFFGGGGVQFKLSSPKNSEIYIQKPFFEFRAFWACRATPTTNISDCAIRAQKKQVERFVFQELPSFSTDCEGWVQRRSSLLSQSFPCFFPIYNTRRTNVQQLTCKIDSSRSFYYLFLSFVLLELKPFVLKGKVPGEKLWKSAKKVPKSVKIMKRFCPLVVAL